MPQILAIETSCDDSSAAVVRDGEIVSLLVSSQKDHNEWGGVVPEIASRAHLNHLFPLIGEALRKAGTGISEIDAVAVTSQPGLIGSLLVGLNAAKGIAVARGIPMIAVNHIEAHLLSVLIENEIDYPYLALVVSGGHTMLYDVAGAGNYTMVGATRDDAAGEAFDKGAKLLGLGYPGGPIIDERAAKGNPKARAFPRALMNDASYDFSFSGLKTSLRYLLRDEYGGRSLTEEEVADLAASYQEAIVDALVRKTMKAAAELDRERIAVVGGVSANSRLRTAFAEMAGSKSAQVFWTSPIYSTDNAGMIGLVGWFRFRDGAFDPLSVVAKASIKDARSVRGRPKNARASER